MAKKIKYGQTYNTDTATLVHYFHYRGDDGYEGLYQTRHGAFFVWQYDMGEGSGDITPLTDEEAYKWLDQHANFLLDQYFGPFPEGGAAERRLTVRLPANLARRLEALADEKGLSLNSYVMRCFEKCAAADGRGVETS
jgi:hypothetical protein